MNICSPMELLGSEVAELRVFPKDSKYREVYSGYFSDPAAMQKAAGAYDGKGEIYITLNAVNPDLIYKDSGGKLLRARDGDTTSDKDVIRRRWILVDFDPKRPAKISSTDEEKAMAWERLEIVKKNLSGEGFTEPVVCDSGNGYHLLYRIDLENNSENTQLIKSFLECLANQYDTDKVEVDKAVFNAARITKFYGAMTMKGANAGKRPHRRSGVISVPQNITATSRNTVAQYISWHTVPKAQTPAKRSSQIYVGQAFDFDRWLSDHGIPIKRTEPGNNGGTRYILEDGCPFNPEHKGKDAVLYKHPSGEIGFKCFHNSCADKTWRDFRLLYEPDAYRPKQETAVRDFAGVAPADTEATAKAIETVLAAEPKSLNELVPDELLNMLFGMEDEVGRQREIAKLKAIAKKHGFARDFDALIKAKRDQLDKARVAVKRQEQTGAEDDAEYIILPEIPLEGLRKPFLWTVDTQKGIWRMDDFEGLIKACAHPLIITDRLQNVDTKMEKLNLAFYRDKQWKSVPVKRSTAASRTGIVALADNGIQVTSENAKHLVSFLNDLETANACTIPRRKSITRMGWVGKEFFPYMGSYVFDGEEELRDMYDGIREAGGRRAWLDMIGGARRENMTFRALLAASFSAPLLWILGNLCYCAHLWGPSGTGKTVAVYTAMSVWGDPMRLTRSFNATEIGLEKCAGFCHSIPMAVDERETAKDDKYAAFDRLIYRLTEGRGRTKSDRNGGLKPTGQWRIPILTSGEAPLLADNSKGGAMNRVLELYCEAPLFEDMPGMADFVKENYGWAGRAFVEQLGKVDLEIIKGVYKAFLAHLRECGQYNDKPLASLAAIMTADFYASLWVFNQDGGAAMARATQLGEEMLENARTKEEADTAGQAWDFLCGWVASNRNHFSPLYDPCWGVIGPNFVFVIREPFNTALTEAGYNPLASAKEFARRELLIKPGQKGLQYDQRINGVKARGYRLKIEVEPAAVPNVPNVSRPDY